MDFLTDAPHLNFFEKAWMRLFSDGNELLTLTLVTFVFHEIVYFGRFVPFWICDFIPALKKYKIQQTKENSSENYAKCMRQLLFNHFCIQLPMMLGFHPFAEYFGMEITTVPFPPLSKMAFQVGLFFLFEDFYHYWAHRLLHHGAWYKHIHKVHHEFAAPFGIAAEYAHPLETLILGMGTIGGPILWVCLTADLHIITVLAWITFRLIQTIDAHSGYDFPWSLRHIMPFWGGADFHDYHHMAFKGNYASTFRWWDWMFATDKGFNSWRARQQAPKAGKAE